MEATSTMNNEVFLRVIPRLSCQGPLTIWPVYAYTLAAQNTVIKLPMLILYTEDNSSMSCEETRVQIFTYFVIIW